MGGLPLLFRTSNTSNMSDSGFPAIEQRPLTENQCQQVEKLIGYSREMNGRTALVLAALGGGWFACGFLLEWLRAPLRTALPVLAAYVLVSLGIAAAVNHPSWVAGRKRRRLLRADIEAGQVEVRTYSIKRVVEIEEWEDIGAGFLVETDTGEVMFLRSQDLYGYKTRGLPRYLHIPYTFVSKTRLCEELDGELTPLTDTIPAKGQVVEYLLEQPTGVPVEGSFDHYLTQIRQHCIAPPTPHGRNRGAAINQ